MESFKSPKAQRPEHVRITNADELLEGTLTELLQDPEAIDAVLLNTSNSQEHQSAATLALQLESNPRFAGRSITRSDEYSAHQEGKLSELRRLIRHRIVVLGLGDTPPVRVAPQYEALKQVAAETNDESGLETTSHWLMNCDGYSVLKNATLADEYTIGLKSFVLKKLQAVLQQGGSNISPKSYLHSSITTPPDTYLGDDHYTKHTIDRTPFRRPDEYIPTTEQEHDALRQENERNEGLTSLAAKNIHVTIAQRVSETMLHELLTGSPEAYAELIDLVSPELDPLTDLSIIPCWDMVADAVAARSLALLALQAFADASSNEGKRMILNLCGAANFALEEHPDVKLEYDQRRGLLILTTPPFGMTSSQNPWVYYLALATPVITTRTDKPLNSAQRDRQLNAAFGLSTYASNDANTGQEPAEGHIYL